MSPSCLISVACVSVLIFSVAVICAQSLICVSKSVALVIKANFVSHSIPLFIKVSRLVLLKISVDIMLTLLITNFLLYYFSALTIKHAFMGHFLVTSCRVFIHLLSFSYSFSIWPNCPFGLSLIHLLNRSTVRANLRWVAVLHHLKSITSTPFHPHHIVSLTHHLVHISKTTSVEKGIVLEGVFKSKTFEHPLRHLVKLVVNIFVSLHHLSENIIMGVWNRQYVVTFRPVVRLNWPVSIGHLKLFIALF